MSPSTPYYQDERAGIAIYCGACEDILPQIADASISLVAMDPPYCGVVGEDWDNQWPTEDAFLVWLDGILAQAQRALADNGSLYVCTSPQMHSRVDALARHRFAVLASIVWDKADGRQGAAGSGIDVTSLRTYWASTSERIVFAEQRVNGALDSADAAARAASGYWQADEQCKSRVFGDYLRAEFARAGATNKQIAALFPSVTGRLTGCVSNWLLGANIPTAEQYATMQENLNAQDGDEYLRREYEGLRREYEGLRRPFNLTKHDQWGEVWRFGLDRVRLHPTQKPLALMQQIVRVSSRLGDMVLDPFMGSGTTLVAAKALGRRAIGIEREERYCAAAVRRLAQEVLPL